MKEQIVIRDFGPIRKAKIDVRDLTVFIGPQATGKSMAAQVLHFMRGLDPLALHPVEAFSDSRQPRHVDTDTQAGPETDFPLQDMLSGLEWWLGNESSVYTTSKTALSWNPESRSKKSEYSIGWDKQGPKLNEALEKRIRERPILSMPQVYIPAGRALYSFLPPVSALRLLSRGRLWPQPQWPGYILTFYEALGAAINQLWRQQERQPLFEAALRTDFLQSRIDAVIKGQIRYGPDTILLKVKQQHLRAETIAAGQMEIWPFWAIVEESVRSGHFDSTRIYFEEPEAHLHPGAQRDVMEIIAYLVRQGGQFVITTHSPYILYAINNSLMAQKVLDKGRNLPPDVPGEIALRPEQVAAYRFSGDGTVHNIMDDEVGLIDENELDQVADELGATFARLQERMEEVE